MNKQETITKGLTYILIDSIKEINTAHRKYGTGNELHNKVSHYLQLNSITRNYLPQNTCTRINNIFKKVQKKWCM